jgi:hypothetical protein
MAIQATPGGMYRIREKAFGTSLPQFGVMPADYFPVDLVEFAMRNVNQVIAGRGTFCVVMYNFTEGEQHDEDTIDVQHGTVLMGKFWQGGWRIYAVDPSVIYYARMNVGHRRFYGDVERFLESCGDDQPNTVTKPTAGKITIDETLTPADTQGGMEDDGPAEELDIIEIGEGLADPLGSDGSVSGDVPLISLS